MGCKRGFTLVELLMVIGIISILAALLFPAVSRAKAQARSSVCSNNLHQLGIALKMYLDEHEGRYPYGVCPTQSRPEQFSLDRWWCGRLLSYHPVRWINAAYHCPGYKGEIREMV